MLHKYPLETRADFQQFYNLNIDDMGQAYTARHAADLLVMLPPESRVFRSINPSNAWSLQDHILSSIEYSLRWLAWAQTKDGQHNRNRPKQIQPPESKAKENKATAVYDINEYSKKLSAPRKEVNRGEK